MIHGRLPGGKFGILQNDLLTQNVQVKGIYTTKVQKSGRLAVWRLR